MAKISDKIKKQARQEVSSLGLKKGLHTVNHAIAGLRLTSSAVSAATAIGIAAVDIALAPIAGLTIGGAALGSVITLGEHALVGMVTDKLT